MYVTLFLSIISWGWFVELLSLQGFTGDIIYVHVLLLCSYDEIKIDFSNMICKLFDVMGSRE